ncbi:MAG TPA: hypothetical protein VKD71_09270, partial [Gemmataceae bacterium]|nr:hypothetical protein [Gemmataceae bacterium]
VRELGRPGQHQTVRLAVARALVVLSAKEAAADLARVDVADPELRALIDPALAKWDYQPARAGWLERLDQPPNRGGMILAIQALGTVREEKAIPRLRELALGRRIPAPVRLEAALALGRIRPSGLESEAEALARDPARNPIVDRLVAASLVRHHQGDKAVAQLQQFARDTEPTVAAVALARLVELDTKLVIPLLESVLASPDANVREFGVETLLRQPTADHIRLLGDRLNDPHPGVRTRARQALRELASKPEWRGAVIRESTRLLNATDWRGLEQSAILLAELDHKPAAKRLLGLLPNERAEVFVAAAWGLRRLAVPETLPPVFEFFEGQWRLMQKVGSSAGRTSGPERVDVQLSHLAQFLGQGRYRPADAVLRRLIPPSIGQNVNPAGHETRAAAIWALGYIHEGKPVPELSQALFGRLTAVGPIDLEDIRVRRMSAISLGRMQAVDLLGTLRGFYSGKPNLDVVNNAVGWAIEQMTGEKVPPAETIEITPLNWFLTSID